jgi:hypothetical protein
MNLRRKYIILPCIGLLFCMTCCGQQGVQELGFGGYWYVLPVPKSDFQRVGDHGISWTCNGWNLLVDDNELIYFNSVYYGHMNRGDELTVTWEGQLFLNGKKLDPIPDATNLEYRNGVSKRGASPFRYLHNDWYMKWGQVTTFSDSA